MGQIPAHWAARRLRTLGTFSKGFGGSKEDNREAGIPVVRYGDLYTTFDTVITKPVAYVDEETAERYATLHTGTLVLTASGEDPGEIGKASLSQLPGQLSWEATRSCSVLATASTDCFWLTHCSRLHFELRRPFVPRVLPSSTSRLDA